MPKLAPIPVMPNLGVPDLGTILAMPDLRVPDLRVPDLGTIPVMPGLGVPDLGTILAGKGFPPAPSPENRAGRRAWARCATLRALRAWAISEGIPRERAATLTADDLIRALVAALHDRGRWPEALTRLRDGLAPRTGPTEPEHHHPPPPTHPARLTRALIAAPGAPSTAQPSQAAA